MNKDYRYVGNAGIIELHIGDLVIDQLTGHRGLLQRRYKTKPFGSEEEGVWTWEIYWFKYGNMILNVYAHTNKKVIGYKHYSEDALLDAIRRGSTSLYCVKVSNDEK